MKPVKDIWVDDKGTADGLVRKMFDAGGFVAKAVADGVDILETGLSEDKTLKFLSFNSAIISTGTRGIIADMIKQRKFNVVISTCGTWDHDLARTYKEYYHGAWDADDAKLRDKGINRLGNLFVPDASYGAILEKKMKEILEQIEAQRKEELSTHELSWEIGRFIAEDDKLSQARKEQSILYWCFVNKIPLIVPGPTDGSVGYQVWQWAQDKRFRFDLLKDESLLSNLVWEHKRSGALIIGGGISKHHVIWWAQFGKGLDWSVYITTAVEWDGSLSGARPREAVSWGKIKEKARTVTIDADATLALPVMWGALKGRIKF